MAEFSVLVESSTHDDLRMHRLCTETAWTTVEAVDDSEAQLVAAQMATCRGRYVTRTTPEL